MAKSQMVVEKEAIESEPAVEKAEQSASKTVKMVREYTVPSEADVHVDEVVNWKRHGWSLK